jgi:hypothetical protein
MERLAHTIQCGGAAKAQTFKLEAPVKTSIEVVVGGCVSGELLV